VAIKILRKSGPVCRGSDTEDIRSALTRGDTGEGVWPGVITENPTLQLLTQYEEVSNSRRCHRAEGALSQRVPLPAGVDRW
jgi:hypothetical protein